VKTKNSKIVALIGVAALMGIGAIIVTSALTTPYSLGGHIYDKASNPIVGANITFTNQRTSEVIYWDSTSGGEYSADAANFPSGYENGDNITYHVIYDGAGGYTNDTYLNDTWALIDTSNGGTLLDITLDQAPTVPTSPTNLGMNLVDHTPTITWTKGTDADSGDTVTTYVYVGTGASPTTVETSTTSETANLGSTVTLTDGVTYYYRLRSYDGERWSDYTADDQFRMNSVPTTSSVDVQGAQEIQHITDHTPDITWNYGDSEGDTQTKYNATVWTGTGGTGTLMGNSGDVTSAGTTWTYSGSTLVDGSTYYARVRTYDGYEWSAWSEIQFRMNSKPTVSSVEISPGTAYTNTDLTGSGTYSDTEGDTESGTTYKWFKNGSLISGATTTSLASSNFKRGDEIIFQYTPNDGYEAGTPVNSSVKTISNSLPTTPTTLDLTSSIYVGSTLTATGSGSTDADTVDGDTLTYYYEFKDNATELQAYSTNYTYVIPESEAHATITVNCKVYDGVTYSSVKSGNKVVSDTKPTTPSGSSIGGTTSYVGDTLTVTGAGSTDADGDTVTYQYEFRRGGVSGTVVQALNDTNTYTITTADAHDTIYVLVYGRAYGVNSDNYEAESRVVTNSVPVLASIGAKTVDDKVEVSVDADATDGDDDARTYSCNRTDLFSDFSTSTGVGHFTPFYNQSGVYYVDFGVSDGYGGTDNETITVTVNDVTFDTTGLSTSAYNILAYVGKENQADSSAEQFGDDIENVDYVVKYNGTFTTHIMGYTSYNFTVKHGLGYYVYIKSCGSTTYTRSVIDDAPYTTTLTGNDWNLIGWTNTTDTNAEGLGSDIGSNCKYTATLNADGTTFTTHIVGFTSNNFDVTKGKGYYAFVDATTEWERET